MKKRIAALLLTLVMMLSLFPTTVFAAGRTGQIVSKKATISWTAGRRSSLKGMQVSVTGAGLSGKRVNVEALEGKAAQMYFDAIEAEGNTLINPMALDITIVDNKTGEEVQPFGDVNVAIKKKNANLDSTVYHFVDLVAGEQQGISPISDLKGVGELDADAPELTDDGTAVAPLTFEALPSATDGDTATVTTKHFSVYVISEGEDDLQTPRTTYHFLNELAADGTAEPYTFVNKAGDLVDYQIVKNDEKLEDPGEPVTGLEKNFLGWFIVEKNGETYNMTDEMIDFTQPHPKTATSFTGDLDVYVAPRFGQAFIVTFWDKSKDETDKHIVAKRVVYLDEGKTYAKVQVNNVEVPSAATEVLTGWTSDDYKAGAQTTYTLAQKPVWDEVANSFNLYPIFSAGKWLRFSGGSAGSGAGYREAIFVTANTEPSELAELGTVDRDGYSFLGWFYDGFDGTDAATDSTGHTADPADLLARVLAAEGDLTLYANWTGNPANYKVATWFENADDNEYSFGELKGPYTGASGQYTNVTADTVSGFTAQTVEQQVVKGDGTTVVNVYYKRNVYEVKFYQSREQQGGGWFSDPYIVVTAGAQIPSLTISAKYGANIHDRWPGGAWWESTGTDPQFTTGITTMPLNGHSYYQMSSSSNTWLDWCFMVQNVSGTNDFSVYVHNTFQSSLSTTTGASDYTAIEGFRVNAYSQRNADTIRNASGGDPNATCNTNFNRSPQIGASFNNATAVSRDGRTYYTHYVYYLRNQYSIVFNTQIAGAPAVSDITGIYYEANIASTKAAELAALNNTYKVGETKVDVTGSGTYVFKGWYDNADGMGDPYDFNHKMPASNITLYAKWEKVTYLVQIDPRGGEIRPDVNEVTYTWLEYGKPLRRYNVRRDYVQAAADYSGDTYYYVNVLASDDPNARADSGAYSSAYRKGFYIKTTDLNNPEYAWWRENGFIDTETEYMPATTNDNWAFVGWYKAEIDPVTHVLTDTNEIYDFPEDGITGETAIYARWRRSGLFNVQYHTQNGTVSGLINNSMVATDSSYADAAKTKISYAPDKITSTDGKRYVFVGWKLADPRGFDPENPGSATLVGDLYKQGDDFEVNAEYADSGHFIHLVAIYQEAEFNPETLTVTDVTFDPNFPTGAQDTNGVLTTITGVPLNTAIDLSKTSFTYTVFDENGNESEKTGTIPQFSAKGYKQVAWERTDGTRIKLNATVGVDTADPKDNILKAVWEPTYFYIYHTSTGVIQRVSIAGMTEDTFDLTSTVGTGKLYGGYYESFTGTQMTKAQILAASYDDDSKTYTDTTAVPYDAKTANVWKGITACTDPGDKLVPKADEVYYVKEVPDSYLLPYIHYTYDEVDPTHPIKKLYMLTATDDTLYESAGYVLNPATEDATVTPLGTKSLLITIKNPSGTINTKLTAKSAFDGKTYQTGKTASVSRGYLYWADISDKIGTEFIYQPYWMTKDGVLVKGVIIRTVNGGTTKDAIGVTDVAAN